MINDNRYNVIKSYLINLLIFLVKSGLKEYLTSVTGFYYFLTLRTLSTKIAVLPSEVQELVH